MKSKKTKKVVMSCIGRCYCPPTTKVKIACVGCRSAVEVRQCRIRRADYYLCGPCEHSGEFEHPKVIEGCLRETEGQAAANFSGFTIRLRTREDDATDEHLLAILRGTPVVPMEHCHD
jgi:hypothetical protein